MHASWCIFWTNDYMIMHSCDYLRPSPTHIICRYRMIYIYIDAWVALCCRMLHWLFEPIESHCHSHVRSLSWHPAKHSTSIFFAECQAHVSTTPDVLSWACLAAGALSECEYEESQEQCRNASWAPFVECTCVILYQAGVGNAMIFSCAQLFGYNDMSFFSRWVFHHDAKWESGIFCYGTIPFIHLMFFLTQATTYEAGFQWLGCSGQFERSTLGNLLGSGPGCSCSLQILPNNLIQPICIRTFIYA